MEQQAAAGDGDGDGVGGSGQAKLKPKPETERQTEPKQRRQKPSVTNKIDRKRNGKEGIDTKVSFYGQKVTTARVSCGRGNAAPNGRRKRSHDPTHEKNPLRDGISGKYWTHNSFPMSMSSGHFNCPTGPDHTP